MLTRPPLPRSANHPDGQIFTPPHLLNPDGSLATRPIITAAPLTAGPSSVLSVTTDSNITMFSFIRRGYVPTPGIYVL